MCSISDIPCVQRASDYVVKVIYRGIRYIICYKANVEKLQSEINALNIKDERIQRKVVEAENNGKIVEKHVPIWHTSVEDINKDLTVYLKENEGKTWWRCFPNPYWRWKLGRWAVKQTTTVSELADLNKQQLEGELSYFPDKDISNNTQVSSSTSTGYHDFESRQGACHRILEALSRDEDGFPVVAIYGLGGLGKTRMMEKVSLQVQAEGIFRTVALATVGQEVNVEKIQDDLARGLKITEKQNNDRAFQLKTRLSNGEKILVILDDVWTKIDYAEIGIPFGDPRIKGCKILLTSRLGDVCHFDNKCKEPIEIEALTVDEAWQMFTTTVGTSIIDYVGEPLAREVCKKCARLPLIIDVVGNALAKKKDRHSWKDALEQLLNCKPEKIPGVSPEAYAGLELSFKVLEEDARLCLLLCSLYGEDEEIEIDYDLFSLATGSGLLKGWNTLEAARNRVDAMVSELKSSSLLLQGKYHNNRVKVHDIIRDVARSFAANATEYAFLSKSCDSLWPNVDDLSSQKLIKLGFGSRNVNFHDDLHCSDLHTLYLNCGNMPGELLPVSFFKSFPQLRCLLLKVKYLSILPSSLQTLERLRSLTIEANNVDGMAVISQLKNLEMLSLWIFRFRGMLPDFRQLRHLRILRLRWSCNNEILDVLSSLPYLEELYLPRTQQNIRSSCALSKLNHLTRLEMCFKNAESCPDENFCKKLSRYTISVSDSLHDKHYSAVKSISLRYSCIAGGVKTLVERADEVILYTAKGVQNCFSQGGVGGAFTELKRLDVSFCVGNEFLLGIPTSQHVGSFSNLTSLGIYNSDFKYLFSTSVARCLQQLEFLTIRNCDMMEVVVWYDCQIEEDYISVNFPKLSYLSLGNLPMLKSFCGKRKDILLSTTTEIISQVHSIFDGTVVFPALTQLDLQLENNNITEIWKEQGHLDESFCQLESLDVVTCHKLKNVIPYSMCHRLQNLKVLYVQLCDSLISEIQDPSGSNKAYPLVVLPRLQRLSLHLLFSLKETGLNSGNINFYPNLEDLTIEGCNKLRNVFQPSVAGHLKFLKRIEVNNCKTMNEIIAYVKEEIITDQGHNVQFIADTCEQILFSQLLTVNLDNLPDLKHFSSSPHYCLKMPLLQKFKVLKCSKFVSFTPGEIISSPMVDIEITYTSRNGREQNAFLEPSSLTDINNYLQGFMTTQGARWFDKYEKDLEEKRNLEEEKDGVVDREQEDDEPE